MNRCDHAAPTAHVIDRVSRDAQIAELWSAIFENFNMEHYRCRNILRAAKSCLSLLVRSVFCGAESAPWRFLVIAIEFIVGKASTESLNNCICLR